MQKFLKLVNFCTRLRHFCPRVNWKSAIFEKLKKIQNSRVHAQVRTHTQIFLRAQSYVQISLTKNFGARARLRARQQKKQSSLPPFEKKRVFFKFQKRVILAHARENFWKNFFVIFFS